MTQSHSNRNNGTVTPTNGDASTKSSDVTSKVIRLHRNGNAPLGFSIRGGWEHGTGIYVSAVHEGSEAHKQGLERGDEICRINGFSLSHAIHDEVISLIKSSSKLTLKVKSKGVIPVKDSVNDVLSWKVIHTPCVLTPPYASSDTSVERSLLSCHSVDSDNDHIEAKILINLCDEPSLGCSVVKGPGNGLRNGIYIQSVKSGGIAESSGLQMGDQIIDCNGINFLDIAFADAIVHLKSYKLMTLTVRKGAGNDLFENGGITESNQHNYVHRNRNESIKEMPALVPHDTRCNHNGHSRVVSCFSNSSSSCSVETARNGYDNSDNDYSICEIEECDNGTSSDRSVFVMEKVKREEQRLAIERRKLEKEQSRLKMQMEKLQIEKRELNRRKDADESQSLSNCSISSASASSSSTGSGASRASNSMNFLEEIKLLGEKRNLKPVKVKNDNCESNEKPSDNTKKLKGNVLKGDDKFHKQHELLMEEFRCVHRKMFGNVQQNETGELEKCHKSPPPVPVKKGKQNTPIVTIGTYQQSNNNRFVQNAQNHRSIIQVKTDDSNAPKSQLSPPITIKSCTIEMDIDGNERGDESRDRYDVSADLLQQFSCLNTTDRDVLIAQLKRLLGDSLNDDSAQFWLDMNNWNLQAAVCSYFDYEEPHPQSCDHNVQLPSMRFVSDVTIGEGFEVPPNSKFTKTWRIANAGDDSWPHGCALRFIEGDQMCHNERVIVNALNSGEMTDVSVDMISPQKTGTYQGQWRMSTPIGQLFGDVIWVIITVSDGGLLSVTQQMSRFHELGSSVLNSRTGISNPFASGSSTIGLSSHNTLIHENSQQSMPNNHHTLNDDDDCWN